MSSAWRHGSSRRWRRIRAVVLARDRHQCQLRIEGVCTIDATCVHHVRGRSITGDDPRWLVASCQPCNLAIGEPSTHQPRIRRVTKW